MPSSARYLSVNTGTADSFVLLNAASHLIRVLRNFTSYYLSHRPEVDLYI